LDIVDKVCYCVYLFSNMFDIIDLSCTGDSPFSFIAFGRKYRVILSCKFKTIRHSLDRPYRNSVRKDHGWFSVVVDFISLTVNVHL